MEHFFWIILVAASILGLSFAYFFPEKPFYMGALGLVFVAAWALYPASYLYYFLVLQLIFVAYLGWSAWVSRGTEASGQRPFISAFVGKFALILPVFLLLAALFWFLLGVRAVDPVFILRPEDSPAAAATFAELWEDVALYKSVLAYASALGLLLLFAIIRYLLKLRGVGTR